MEVETPEPGNRAPNRPIDVATTSTLRFLAGQLPRGVSLVEVGCGEGHVALGLLELGYDVTAIDPDLEAVEIARKNGVPAVQASWAEFECPRVDAIAFTRSLHHIHPLGGAIHKARDVLGPHGLLLVEDFAFEAADTATVEWFVSVLNSPTGMALLEPAADEFTSALLGAGDPLDEWRRNHDHELHGADAMTEAILEHFAIREAGPVPYLYRYLIPALPNTREAAMFVSSVLHEEARLAARGHIVLLGRRIAAVAE